MRRADPKIVSREHLRDLLAERKHAGAKVVFANGCFDTRLALGGAAVQGDRPGQHEPRHVAKRFKRICHLKGPGRPILPESARAELVAALRAVDYVVVFGEPNVESLLEFLRPDVHAKGTDYSAETVPERATAARLGIRVAIVGDPKDHSTRDFLDSVRKAPHV